MTSTANVASKKIANGVFALTRTTDGFTAEVAHDGKVWVSDVLGSLGFKTLAECKHAVAISAPTEEGMFEAIRRHAVANFENGWAQVLDASRAEIEQIVAGAATEAAAIGRVRRAIVL